MRRDPKARSRGRANQDPCPASQAIRPSTGLSQAEGNEARGLVRCLMQREMDRLPDGRTLSEVTKERVYAAAAVVLSGQSGRPVTVEEIKLAANLLRGRVTQPTRYTTGLSPEHHRLAKAQAEVDGTSIVAVVRAALDAHLEPLAG